MIGRCSLLVAVRPGVSCWEVHPRLVAESGGAIRSQGALPCVTSRGSRAAPASRPWCPASRSMPAGPSPAGVTREEVERAIRDGVRFLKGQQLRRRLMAGRRGRCPFRHHQPGDARPVDRRREGRFADDPPALELLRRLRPEDLRSTYAIGLQTMVFAAADPERDRLRIAANVDWLEGAQIKPGDPIDWPGSWTYTDFKRGKHGDNSNSQYALLGLHAASEAGVPVKAEVWALARAYWERSQKNDGSWAYTPDSPASSAKHDPAGVSSLIISGMRRYQGQEFLQGEKIVNCGKGGQNRSLQRGIDWLARNFQVRKTPGAASSGGSTISTASSAPAGWPASATSATMTGIAWAPRSWSRTRTSSRDSGRGHCRRRDPILSTSFALLFLAKGRARC